MMKSPQSHDVTITERLRTHAEIIPNQVAYTFLRDDGKIDTITYGKLFHDVRLLAAALLNHAEAGSRALLLYPSGLEFIKVYLACLTAGIIAVPSSMPKKARPSSRLGEVLRDAGPSLILTTSDCLRVNEAACFDSGIPSIKFLATNVLPGNDREKQLLPISCESIAFLQYTSGSTASPKGVEVTHKNITSNVKAIEHAFGFDKTSVMVGWLPLFHDMGLIGSVLAPLYVGFHSVLMSPGFFLKNPFAWLEAISYYRATCAGSPNFGWDYCVDRIPAEKRSLIDLRSLRVAYNGSESVRAHTLERFYKHFSICGLTKESLFPCYGMAETTLFVSGGPVDKAPRIVTVSKMALEGNQIKDVAPESEDARQIVSCGVVSPDMTVLVVDPDTALVCSQRRLGEIWISGASVANGYWNRPEQTQQTFQSFLAESGDGPFLRTGDLGFIRDGEIFIAGRLKDLIVINGRNIYPQDIEQVIEESIDFVEPNMCAAFAVEQGSTESLAIVAEANRSLMRAAQFEQNKTGSENTRIRLKNEYLVKLQTVASDICAVITDQFDVSVSSIAFVKPGTFPRTSSGKVQRVRCKQLALNNQLDIVYVMPDSVFDRRQSHESNIFQRNVLFERRQSPNVASGNRHVAAGTIPEKDSAVKSPNLLNQCFSQADTAESKRRADSMISWFRDYAGRRLNSRLIDERRTIPPYVVLDLGNKGFFGLQVPAELGGCNLTTVDLLRVIEQVAGVDLTIALLVGVHNGLGMRPIQRYGNEALIKNILPGLASGRQLAAFALTEPSAGSNPVAMQATAVQVDGGWIVNAEKQWIGIGSWAGVLTVFVKAFGHTGTPLGLVALIIPEDTPGITQGPEALTMGMRGIVQNTVYIKNAFVPDSALLGVVGEGMMIAQDAMMFSRLGIGVMSLGAMKRCAQLMMRYATRRSISTGILLDNAVTLEKLEEVTTAIAATESLIYEVAKLVDEGKQVPVEAYIACKTAAPEFLGKAADNLIQLLGGRGYVETNGASQIFRDARILRIFEGPTETLNMHLGSIVCRQSDSVSKFISTTLGSPEAASLLGEAIFDLQERASAFNSVFPAEAALDQWVHFQCGQLTTGAIVFASAQKTFRDKAQSPGAAHAAEVLKNDFINLRNTIMSYFTNGLPCRASQTFIDIVAKYETSIGDIDQTLSGEAHQVDPMISRHVSAFEFPSIDLAAFNNRELPPAVLAITKENYAHADSDENIILNDTKVLVHRTILKWLKTEKRKQVTKLDENVMLSSLGMDSLGAINLSLELERQMGAEISPEIIYECQTVGGLTNYFKSKLISS